MVVVCLEAELTEANTYRPKVLGLPERLGEGQGTQRRLPSTEAAWKQGPASPGIPARQGNPKKAGGHVHPRTAG